MNYNYKKNIFSIVLSVSLLIPVITVVQGAKFANAGTSNVSLDKYLPRIAALASTSSALEKSDSMKMTVFGKIAFTIAQNFINANVKSVVAWAYNGFDGKPQFVQNLSLTYENAQSKIFKLELEKYATKEYGSMYTKKLLLALISDFTGKSTNPFNSKITNFTRDVIKEKQTWNKFLTGSGFSNSDNDIKLRKQNLTNFWSKYSALTNENGNLLSEYIKTKQEIQSQIDKEKEEIKENLQLNNGFIGQQECLRTYSFDKKQKASLLKNKPADVHFDTQQTGTSENPYYMNYNYNYLKNNVVDIFSIFKLNKVNAQDKTEVLQKLTPKPITDFLPTETYIQYPSTNIPENSQDPLAKDKLEKDKLEKYGQGKVNKNPCAVYATTLPGVMVESLFKKATDQPLEEAQKVDTWYELLSSTLTSLADEITKQGTSLGVNWARKKVAEGIDNARAYTQSEIKELLKSAPESNSSNEVYLTGQSIEEELEPKITPEMEKCLKNAGLTKKFIDELNIDIYGGGALDLSNLGNIFEAQPENVKIYADLASMSESCGFSKINLVAIQVTQLDIAAKIVTETIPYVRKLDICIPGPDKGWEVRFATAFTASRNALTAKIDDMQGIPERNDDGSIKINPYEQYAQRLDEGYNSINEYMQKKINNPIDAATIDGSVGFKALVDQADNVYIRKKEAEGLLSQYIKIYDRMVAIKKIWEEGVEPDTSQPIGPRYTAKLLQELQSYSGYTDDNQQSEQQLNETLDYLTSIIQANKSCIAQRNHRDEKTKQYDGYLNATDSGYIYALYSNVEPSTYLYSQAILKRLKVDPTVPLPNEKAKVVFTNEQIAYLDTIYGNQRNNSDSQDFYNYLNQSGTIDVKASLIPGSQGTFTINPATVKSDKYSNDQTDRCRVKFKGGTRTFPNSSSPPYTEQELSGFDFPSESESPTSLESILLNGKQNCYAILYDNGTVVSSGGGGGYTTQGSYTTQYNVDNTKLKNAIADVNVNGGLKQIGVEANDSELAFYCVGGYLSGPNAPYIAGIEFGVAPKSVENMIKAEKIMDTILGIGANIAAQSKDPQAQAAAKATGAFLNIKQIANDAFGFTAKKDQALNPPSKFFQGFSCGKFYSAKSNADYDPSIYNISY